MRNIMSLLIFHHHGYNNGNEERMRMKLEFVQQTKGFFASLNFSELGVELTTRETRRLYLISFYVRESFSAFIVFVNNLLLLMFLRMWEPLINY